MAMLSLIFEWKDISSIEDTRKHAWINQINTSVIPGSGLRQSRFMVLFAKFVALTLKRFMTREARVV